MQIHAATDIHKNKKKWDYSTIVVLGEKIQGSPACCVTPVWCEMLDRCLSISNQNQQSELVLICHVVTPLYMRWGLISVKSVNVDLAGSHSSGSSEQ